MREGEGGNVKQTEKQIERMRRKERERIKIRNISVNYQVDIEKKNTVRNHDKTDEANDKIRQK